MKLEILPSAEEDLADGFWFYEKQGNGLGKYFRESLISEIEGLLTCGGVHRQVNELAEFREFDHLIDNGSGLLACHAEEDRPHDNVVEARDLEVHAHGQVSE